MSIDNTRLYGHIADNLRALRRKKKLTQITLAERAHVARTTVANIEAGQQHPPLHLIYNLCLALDVEPLRLFPTLQAVIAPEPVGYEIDGQTHPITPKAMQFLASLDEE